MNELESYISFIKEKTADYSELEKVRYVYIDLGKKMTFDLNFAFGDEYMKEYIYKHCFYNLDDLNEFFKKKTIICKSLALLFKYIVYLFCILRFKEETYYRHQFCVWLSNLYDNEKI